MNNNRYFLNIDSSFSGFSWVYRLSEREEMLSMATAQGLGIPEIIARILTGRGIQPDQAEAFLNPTIRRDLPNPLSLTDMSCVAQRIAYSIINSEKIVIFGDYDVDGAASCALMKRFFNHFGIESEIYIPDRIFEGYGPNPDSMKELAIRSSLIVTVDCGTNSAAAIQVARDCGCDVVVLDHHQVSGDLPQAIGIVNPNREDDLSNQGHLCAAAVVFLTLVQVSKILRTTLPSASQPDLMSFLDLVALATLCDVVALQGVNRAFVVKGLLAVRQMRNVGLTALINVSNIREPVNTFHLSFLIGPRINAGGRIGDAVLGARLLSTNDPSEARDIAEKLNQLNQERQAMERAMVEQARADVDNMVIDDINPSILIAAHHNWHPGLVGLIAARLKEHTRRPCFAIHFHPNAVGVGSGRSVPDFDLGALVRSAVLERLLVKGGGHKMAAGITVERSRLQDLRVFFNEQAQSQLEHIKNKNAFKIDGALSADSLTFQLLDQIESAGPFGAGHPVPVFVLPHHKLLRAYRIGSEHVKVDLVSRTGARISGIAFRSAQTALGSALFKNQGKDIHVAGTPSVSYWQGHRQIQFRVTDAAHVSRAL